MVAMCLNKKYMPVPLMEGLELYFGGYVPFKFSKISFGDLDPDVDNIGTRIPESLDLLLSLIHI